MGQVISQDNLILQRQKWKGNGQCVVFVSGSFDLLHPGHIRLLEQARSHGDILVVGIQSDASVHDANAASGSSEPAGPQSLRPITPAAERAEIVAALAAVDYVVEFDPPPASGLIARLSPEIVVKGVSPVPDATGAPEGHAAVAAGAKIVRILLEPGYSTAHLIQRIQQAPA